MNWYQKAVTLNDLSAMNQLYIAYRDSFGVPRNESQAMQYLIKAADRGSSFGMLNLAWNYTHGAIGLPKDKVKAILFARKALLVDDSYTLMPHTSGTANFKRDGI